MVSGAGADSGVTINLASQSGAAQATGLGNDVLLGFENAEGSAYGDTITGDETDNEVDGGGGDDTISGGGGEDRLRGGEGNDTIDGGDDFDVLRGEEGDDTLISRGSGGYGDQMYGGDGADEFHFLSRDGADGIVLDFEPDTDQIVIGFRTDMGSKFTWAGNTGKNYSAWYSENDRGVTLYFDVNGDSHDDNVVAPQPDYSIAVWGEFNFLQGSDVTFL